MKYLAIVFVALGLAASATGSQSAAVTPSRARTAPLAVGEPAPDFTLEAHDGRRVRLSESLAKGPAVLVFYRGSWCPFCARQLAELRGFARPGGAVTLLAISVDEPAASRRLAAGIAADGKGAIDFPLLSDPDHKTIDAYGLHDPAYDGDEFDGIPRASVYVIGRDGRVVWARVSEDYKKRPSVAEIRAALGN